MVTLQRVIQYLYPNAESMVNYSVLSHNGEERIGNWNVAVLGQPPTQEQINATKVSPEFLTWLNTLPKKLRKDKLTELLATQQELLAFIVREAVHDLFDALSVTRTRFNTMRQQLVDRGINITVQPLGVPTWEQFKTDLINRLKALIDAET